VSYLCGWLKVSRSGYYDWRKREESDHRKSDQTLTQKIVAIHRSSRGVYGSPRIYKVLQNEGIRVGKKRVARLMQAQGLQGRVVQVTYRKPGLKQFKAQGDNLRLKLAPASGMDQVWVADITYLRVKGQWRYLATVMDVYSRRILGWSLAKHRTTELTLSALNYALKQRQPAPGLLFHTDRGIEYMSHRFQSELKRHGMRSSVNRPGYCTDNAHMESFFHTLKGELIRGRVFHTEPELRYALNSYINGFYNHMRLHSGVGYHSPAQYERMAA
jgi:transposase InsO family protein